jgi:hypothetical protein
MHRADCAATKLETDRFADPAPQRVNLIGHGDGPDEQPINRPACPLIARVGDLDDVITIGGQRRSQPSVGE